jgi:hypothetical protein
MTIEEINSLEQKAKNFLGRLIPLSHTGLQSNENAVFSEISKGFDAKEHESQKKDLNNYSLSARLITARGQIVFVSLDKVVEYFERIE